MQPRRIILTCYGSLGDIHPYLALARELQARGHTPIIATSALYRDKIEAQGIGFHAVRPDLPLPEESGPLIERAMHPLRGPEFLFRRLLMPHLRESYDDLCVIARSADLLVTHPITFAAPIVAQQLKLPWLSTVLSPISLWSLHDPPVPPVLSLAYAMPRLGRGPNQVLWYASRAMTRRWLRPVRQLRHQFGLAANEHPLFEGQHSPHGVLALFSSALATPQPDWPPQSTLCGFCFYDHHGQSTSQEELAPELEAFLQAGEAPIVFTLGSAAVYAARDFFAASAQSARQLSRRALFLVGEKTQLSFSPTANECVAPYAPYSLLFPRAAAVVHQGGIGTTGQALRAGVPQLVVPFSHDQPDNAARIKRLGCGLFIPRQRYSSTRAANALEVLLSQANFQQRAQHLAQIVQSENGPVTTCDNIENALAAAL